jgi:hypothetical protein
MIRTAFAVPGYAVLSLLLSGMWAASSGNRDGARESAGQGTAGDGGPAVDAMLEFPSGVAVHGGFLYISEQRGHRVRRVDLNTGMITGPAPISWTVEYWASRLLLCNSFCC